jgi:hypothetical protein
MLSASSARKLAERIVADETGQESGGDQALSAVKSIHRKLANALSPVVGEAGFEAMFARTVQKGRLEHPALAEVVTGGPDSLPQAVWARLESLDSPVIHSIGTSLLAAFLVLLSRLVGGDLALQLLLSTWPEAIGSGIASPERS